MTYDIYDTDTANLVRSFPTEKAALAMVRRAVKRSGPDAVDSWALTRTDLSGKMVAGPELAQRALQLSVQHAPHGELHAPMRAAIAHDVRPALGVAPRGEVLAEDLEADRTLGRQFLRLQHRIPVVSQA